MQTMTIKIKGMTCMGCVNSVQNVLGKIPGVHSTTVSLAQAQAVIQYDASQASQDQFKQTIIDAGFDVIS